MQAINFIANFRSATLRFISSDCGPSTIYRLSSQPHQRVQNSYLNHITARTMSTQTIYTADYLSEKLKTNLQAEHIDIEDLSNCGCGMKFHAQIVSPQFEGKPLLQRQRLVNQVLDEEMKHIHAFTMRTLTPKEWADGKK